MKMAQYLGKNASSLLDFEQFKHWPVERSVDEDSDPPEVRYVFEDCGLEFNCDLEGEYIRALFFEKERHSGVVLSEIPFSLCRNEVLSQFGTPSKSGEAFSDPILGDYGAWDRFEASGYAIHFQYSAEVDTIEKITLMRSDVVPQSV